ncbi:LacI family DNA-binding transcriptional regulator [Brachybacterium massiliense]|uniref:LacI family DNA-binding transcriptional regulator n=1 Tax=Brachybacterium massiliense TaxID=1755098 RepID=UPI000B3BBD94|nr:LacI family DNA-binding transcriptional regulator [Brachybacterium massiliense]
MTAPPSDRRVTRADVARLAGVSTAVVSYALNDGPRPVAEATKQRVLEAVRLLGYRPNATARALKLGSTSQIGLVVPGVSNPFFAWLTDRIEAQARARGLATVVMNSADSGVLEVVTRIASLQLDGVLIANEVTRGDLLRMENSETSVVLLNQPTEIAGIRSVIVDRYAGAFEAVSHLIGHGHQRIAYTGPADPEEARRRGWSDALAVADLPADLTLRTEYSRDAGLAAATELLEMPGPPTAVFAASDEIASGILLGLHQHGLSTPDDVALISFDGTEEMRYARPPVTSVTQPVDDMVRCAFDLLGPDMAVGAVRLVPQLAIRSSCGCGPSLPQKAVRS